MVQLKGNQKTLLREVSEGCDCLEPTSTHCEIDKSRNRIETRTVDVFDVHSCLVESNQWKPYIGSAIRVKRYTELYCGKTKKWNSRCETGYYLYSNSIQASHANTVVRGHWGIENSNHYVRDVSLGEDASRIRTSPGIFARLRSFALNVLRMNQIKNVKAALFENALDFDGMVQLKGL